MTTFERRQHILRLVQEQSSVHVSDLAQILDVSEGTIRNDLTALEKEHLLVRVRGGAVTGNGQMTAPNLTARVRENFDAKLRIARWAADMIENGDTILFDASTTALSVANLLPDRRNLTVVTNGLEIARALAQNPGNTVILIGGLLRPDGNTITGLLGEKMARDLHIKTAFVSCVGFTVENGLTESDFQQAQLKSQLIRAAERVVALVDSSKFGKVGLVPFATIEQIAQLVTDDAIAPPTVDRLRQAGIALTVCGEDAVDSFLPHAVDSKIYTIGFANLSEAIPFAVDVRRSLERAAQVARNIDLVLADNQLNGQVALEVADNLIARGVDLVIEYQIDEKIGSLIINKFHRAGIPVIAVDIPMVGATYFGVDNYRSGYMAGVALGDWIQQQWQGAVDHVMVLEEPRSGALVAARIQGQLDGLQDTIGKQENISYLDSGNTRDISAARMVEALEQMPDHGHIAVVCFNDDAAIGALEAAQHLERERDVVIVGQGADRRVRDEIRRDGSRIIGSTAFNPEKYGDQLIDLALRILRGEPVPPAVYNEHTFITASNLDVYYPE